MGKFGGLRSHILAFEEVGGQQTQSNDHYYEGKPHEKKVYRGLSFRKGGEESALVGKVIGAA
jgi:hypothetical protein